MSQPFPDFSHFKVAVVQSLDLKHSTRSSPDHRSSVSIPLGREWVFLLTVVTGISWEGLRSLGCLQSTSKIPQCHHVAASSQLHL